MKCSCKAVNVSDHNSALPVHSASVGAVNFSLLKCQTVLYTQWYSVWQEQNENTNGLRTAGFKDSPKRSEG